MTLSPLVQSKAGNNRFESIRSSDESIRQSKSNSS